MKIYPLSADPAESANMLCDEHLKWMPKHVSFLLSAALQSKGVETWNEKSTHLKNHPWSVWAGESMENFWWLASLGKEICVEYSIRYSKHHHQYEGDIQYHWDTARSKNLEWEKDVFTPMPQCVPKEFQSDNAIETYRLYYLNHVVLYETVSWKRNRKSPEWWKGLVKPDRHL